MAATVQTDVSPKGEFVRTVSTYRNRITVGGTHPPAKGRYLLYVAMACPWACRCLSLLCAKGLWGAIEVAVVAPPFRRTKPDEDSHEGWAFEPGYDALCTADPIFGAKTVREIYDRCTPPGQEPAKRFTVPILFDKETRQIVNNESSEIIRDLNSMFNDFAEKPAFNSIPDALLDEIDAMNAANYESVNNGVYKCGFAQSQEAYDIAVGPLFARLDELEALLGTRRYLVGSTPTEADLRLFTTIVRFDEVYVVHFKTNKKLIREYANLSAWMRDVYQTCGLERSVDMKHIREHYYLSHRSINTYGIIPAGHGVDLTSPHGRDARSY